MNLNSIFPPDIATLAVAAEGLPDGVSGWTRESLRLALDALRGTKIAVLEIGVYDRVILGFAPSNTFVPAEESWSCWPTPHETAPDFAIRSRREALEWIEKIERQEVLFVVTFSSQDTAAAASGA